MNIKKFSASYMNCRHNFVISGLQDTKTEDKLLLSFVSVMKNILTRDYPVRISENLLKQISGINPYDDSGRYRDPYKQYKEKCGDPKEQAICFVEDDDECPCWKNTIKGSPSGENPAREFYEKLWGKYLWDYMWVRNLIIPECPLGEIIPVNGNNEWSEEAVDFYLPQIKLVIEVDGAQHYRDGNQIIIDQKRDEALTNAGVTVKRIAAKSVRWEDDSLKKFFKELRQLIDTDERLNPFVDPIEKGDWDEIDAYETVIRFQFTILSLLENGQLSFKDGPWKIDIPEDSHECFRMAAEDLFIWFENLYNLSGREFLHPEIKFSKSSGIKIFCDLNKRYDEKIPDGIGIYTDYWDHEEKDYYSVSCAEKINYGIDLVKDPDRQYNLEFFLRNLFGYENFKDGQLLIIPNVLNLRDTLGILPTGGGKSMCYQLCMMLQPAASFSVCPIISLLMDQNDELRSMGFTRCNYVASTQEGKEKDRIITDFGSGKFQIVFISPERFQDQNFRNQLNAISTKLKTAYAVIDEVHCLSEWGHDFRTSYLTLIQTIRNYSKEAVLVGLTATASQAVLEDLKIELGISSEDVKATTTMDRPNLHFHVITTPYKDEALKELLSDREMVNENTTGLVFTLKRDRSGEPKSKYTILSKIKRIVPNLSSKKFHAGLEGKEKAEIQKEFKEDKINILSTTKAFGMGVNKEDVRYTIHYELPWSVESFYQEAGRAGRSKSANPDDAKRADCYIIYTPEIEEVTAKADRMFNREIGAEEIAEIQSENKDALNDLGTIFYLWTQNNKGVEKDVDQVQDTIVKIWKQRKQSEITIATTEETKKDTEQALYRLRLLGVVQDWTINYGGNKLNIFNITVNQFDEESVRAKFLEYVRRHEPGWKIDGVYKEILEDPNTKYLRKYTKALITWTYLNIIASRREMIRNIRSFCKTYRNEEEFRQRITDFLKISDYTVILEDIAHSVDEINKGEWRSWFNILHVPKYNAKNEMVATDQDLELRKYEEINEACSRFKESYHNNPGINLVYFLSGIMAGRYEKGSYLSALEAVLKRIHETLRDDENNIVSELIEYLDRHIQVLKTDDLQDISSTISLQYRDRAEELYEMFKDDYSLSVILDDRNLQIRKILEAIR